MSINSTDNNKNSSSTAVIDSIVDLVVITSLHPVNRKIGRATAVGDRRARPRYKAVADDRHHL